MRRLLFSSLLISCLFAFSAQAQNSRISELAEKLQQNISRMADNSAKDFFSRAENRADKLNNLLILQQSEATVSTFLLLVRNNRPNSELRNAADALNDRFGKFNSDSASRTESQQIKNGIEELITELKRNNDSQNKNPEKNGDAIGRLFWQGTIDDEVHLIIRGNTVQTKTLAGTEYNDGIFNFTSPLPDEKVQVFVNKKDGRGTAKVIQQPTPDNDFTAIIQVLDKNGGAREYGLEIYWTK